MAQPGHATVVSISADDSTYTTADGITKAQAGRSMDLLETTDFAGSDWRSFTGGLKTGDLTLEGMYEASDTAQGVLRTGWDNGTTVYVKVLTNGTVGWKFTCMVESWDLDADVEALTSFSASLKIISAPTAIT